MGDKKDMNWFFAFIAFTLGLTLIKHIDFKTLTLKKPLLDILYIVVFIIAIYFIIKDLKKRITNKNCTTTAPISAPQSRNFGTDLEDVFISLRLI